jgi:hypothetical protein
LIILFNILLSFQQKNLFSQIQIIGLKAGDSFPKHLYFVTEFILYFLYAISRESP